MSQLALSTIIIFNRTINNLRDHLIKKSWMLDVSNYVVWNIFIKFVRRIIYSEVPINKHSIKRSLKDPIPNIQFVFFLFIEWSLKSFLVLRRIHN